MTIENCHYTLKIRGRSIGSQVLRSQENRRIVYLESKIFEKKTKIKTISGAMKSVLIEMKA